MRRDGSTFTASLTLSVVRDDEAEVPWMVVGIYEDITGRLAAERARAEFVSVVGHELRTPLTSIRGSLGLIASGVLGDLPSEAESMLAIALNNTERLGRLVNDILDIERLDGSGQLALQIEPVEGRDLIEQALAAVRGAATAADVSLVLAPDSDEVVVLADADRIVQTLVNLLGNAIKFSPPSGVVTAKVTDRGRDAEFAVRDDGRGIPADQLTAVFERFHQVDASDARDKDGTGLGLAIAQRIVVHHQGRIWAESELGHGTTMRFTVPTVTRQTEFLVCGVAGDRVDATVALLEALSCAVVRADTVPEAAALLRERRPAAVVIPFDDKAASWATGVSHAATEAGVPVVGLGPYEDPDHQLVSVVRDLVPALAAGTVLIVEDDRSLTDVLSLLLARAEIPVRVARTAAEAIDALRQATPSAVVLDLALAGAGDGFAIIDQARGEGLLAEVPVLVYTALELGHGDRQRLQLGRTEFLPKGHTTPQDIERRVRGILGRLHEHPVGPGDGDRRPSR